MKLEVLPALFLRLQSHPARGAWIEINQLTCTLDSSGSHPARGAWIEISRQKMVALDLKSHPARGAWIEIAVKCER